MTEEMNNTVSCKWTMEEREKMLTTGTLEQQREAFKDDEELMRETSKFVSEVIQTAITEASKRKVLTEASDTQIFCSSTLKKNAVECNYSLRISCFRKLSVKVSFIV